MERWNKFKPSQNKYSYNYLRLALGTLTNKLICECSAVNIEQENIHQLLSLYQTWHDLLARLHPEFISPLHPLDITVFSSLWKASHTLIHLSKTISTPNDLHSQVNAILMLRIQALQMLSSCSDFLQLDTERYLIHALRTATWIREMSSLKNPIRMKWLDFFFQKIQLSSQPWTTLIIQKIHVESKMDPFHHEKDQKEEKREKDLMSISSLSFTAYLDLLMWMALSSSQSSRIDAKKEVVSIMEQAEQLLKWREKIGDRKIHSSFLTDSSLSSSFQNLSFHLTQALVSYYQSEDLQDVNIREGLKQAFTEMLQIKLKYPFETWEWSSSHEQAFKVHIMLKEWLDLYNRIQHLVRQAYQIQDDLDLRLEENEKGDHILKVIRYLMACFDFYSQLINRGIELDASIGQSRFRAYESVRLLVISILTAMWIEYEEDDRKAEEMINNLVRLAQEEDRNWIGLKFMFTSLQNMSVHLRKKNEKMKKKKESSSSFLRAIKWLEKSCELHKIYIEKGEVDVESQKQLSGKLQLLSSWQSMVNHQHDAIFGAREALRIALQRTWSLDDLSPIIERFIYCRLKVEIKANDSLYNLYLSLDLNQITLDQIAILLEHELSIYAKYHQYQWMIDLLDQMIEGIYKTDEIYLAWALNNKALVLREIGQSYAVISIPLQKVVSLFHHDDEESMNHFVVKREDGRIEMGEMEATLAKGWLALIELEQLQKTSSLPRLKYQFFSIFQQWNHLVNNSNIYKVQVESNASLVKSRTLKLKKYPEKYPESISGELNPGNFLELIPYSLNYIELKENGWMMQATRMIDFLYCSGQLMILYGDLDLYIASLKLSISLSNLLHYLLNPNGRLESIQKFKEQCYVLIGEAYHDIGYSAPIARAYFKKANLDLQKWINPLKRNVNNSSHSFLPAIQPDLKLMNNDQSIGEVDDDLDDEISDEYEMFKVEQMIKYLQFEVDLGQIQLLSSISSLDQMTLALETSITSNPSDTGKEEMALLALSKFMLAKMLVKIGQLDRAIVEAMWALQVRQRLVPQQPINTDTHSNKNFNLNSDIQSADFNSNEINLSILAPSTLQRSSPIKVENQIYQTFFNTSSHWSALKSLADSLEQVGILFQLQGSTRESEYYLKKGLKLGKTLKIDHLQHRFLIHLGKLYLHMNKDKARDEIYAQIEQIQGQWMQSKEDQIEVEMDEKKMIKKKMNSFDTIELDFDPIDDDRDQWWKVTPFRRISIVIGWIQLAKWYLKENVQKALENYNKAHRYLFSLIDVSYIKSLEQSVSMIMNDEKELDLKKKTIQNQSKEINKFPRTIRRYHLQDDPNHGQLNNTIHANVTTRSRRRMEDDKRNQSKKEISLRDVSKNEIQKSNTLISSKGCAFYDKNTPYSSNVSIHPRLSLSPIQLPQYQGQKYNTLIFDKIIHGDQEVDLQVQLPHQYLPLKILHLRIEVKKASALVLQIEANWKQIRQDFQVEKIKVSSKIQSTLDVLNQARAVLLSLVAEFDQLFEQVQLKMENERAIIFLQLAKIGQIEYFLNLQQSNHSFLNSNSHSSWNWITYPWCKEYFNHPLKHVQDHLKLALKWALRAGSTPRLTTEICLRLAELVGSSNVEITTSMINYSIGMTMQHQILTNLYHQLGKSKRKSDHLSKNSFFPRQWKKIIHTFDFFHHQDQLKDQYPLLINAQEMTNQILGESEESRKWVVVTLAMDYDKESLILSRIQYGMNPIVMRFPLIPMAYHHDFNFENTSFNHHVTEGNVKETGLDQELNEVNELVSEFANLVLDKKRLKLTKNNLFSTPLVSNPSANISSSTRKELKVAKIKKQLGKLSTQISDNDEQDLFSISQLSSSSLSPQYISFPKPCSFFALKKQFESIIDESDQTAINPSDLSSAPIQNLNSKKNSFQDPLSWWKKRIELDTRLALLLSQWEDQLFGPWKLLLLGQFASQELIQKTVLFSKKIITNLSNLNPSHPQWIKMIQSINPAMIQSILTAMDMITIIQLEVALYQLLKGPSLVPSQVPCPNLKGQQTNQSGEKKKRKTRTLNQDQVNTPSDPSHPWDSLGHPSLLLIEKSVEIFKRFHLLLSNSQGYETSFTTRRWTIRDRINVQEVSRVACDPTILILDKNLHRFPWESLPILSSSPVCRMPSWALLRSQILSQFINFSQDKDGVKDQVKDHILRNGIDVTKAFYVLNPDGDLPKTQVLLEPILRSLKTWDGVVGKAPTSFQLEQCLKDQHLLIYCGHNAGEHYLNRNIIQKIYSNVGGCVALLMGCSSARIEEQAEFDPSGLVLAYMIAGSPAIVGNLWAVTTGDLDIITKGILDWIVSKSKEGTLLQIIPLVREQKNVKLKYLNGAALVYYGLPVGKRLGTEL